MQSFEAKAAAPESDAAVRITVDLIIAYSNTVPLVTTLHHMIERLDMTLIARAHLQRSQPEQQ